MAGPGMRWLRLCAPPAVVFAPAAPVHVRVPPQLPCPPPCLQVRQVVLPACEARGPCKARALAQQLWEGEEFHLQASGGSGAWLGRPPP